MPGRRVVATHRSPLAAHPTRVVAEVRLAWSVRLFLRQARAHDAVLRVAVGRVNRQCVVHGARVLA